MKNKHRKLCLAFLFGFGLTTVQAQEAITATGGNASGSAGTASYSIGQVVYTTNTSGAGSVAEGVQQAFEISIVTSLNEKDIDLQLAAYPNPTADQLTLTSGKDFENLSYQLFDMTGKLLAAEKVVNKQALIKMSNFPSATYLIKVSDNTTVIKTFQIIKN
jgi:hypothetical protein